MSPIYALLGALSIYFGVYELSRNGAASFFLGAAFFWLCAVIDSVVSNRTEEKT